MDTITIITLVISIAALGFAIAALVNTVRNRK